MQSSAQVAVFGAGLVLAGVLAGLGAGYWVLRPVHDPNRALEAQSLRITALQQAVTRLEQAQRATLAACSARSMVERADVLERGDPAPPSEAAASAEVVDPAVDEKILKGHQLVEEALRAGRWTEADQMELRQLMVGLTAEQRDEVLTSVAKGINEGRLRWDGMGVPF